MVGELSGGGEAGDSSPAKAHELEASVALLRQETEIAHVLLGLSATLAPSAPRRRP